MRSPSEEIDLRCGGHAMAVLGEAAPRQELVADHAEGTALGKRYASDDAGLELLCTKAGQGSLAIGDERIPVKGAKPLPSSD